VSAGEFWGRTLLMVAFCALVFVLAFGNWHRAGDRVPAQDRPVDLPAGPPKETP
jgi:hypothetical protein